MQFESLNAFLNMGGYALYVWLSFGVTFLSMGVLALQTKVESKVLLQKVLKEQQRRQRIKLARQKKPAYSNMKSDS
ncbi:heme exporter protein CcmD [Alteromonas sp. ASW11-130]|uniref:heme exporter protein CcmD n=1 Tax=Alteromonas sp. ASW11-130 TaxID=3015775 RepID=UPI00224193C8|nr:heme exporter protein CcmD [Alteromonas sp. ASW11-130]MCW8092826.1 heme exporter protein CcmD [Alteromonas sp. ASW11-130]